MMSLHLSDVKTGTRLKVLGFRAQSEYTDQLERLGLVAGTEFEIIRKAPLGDPVEIRMRGFSLALRPSEAHDLEIEVVK